MVQLSRGCPHPYLLCLVGLPTLSLLAAPHRAANALSAHCASGLMGLLTPPPPYLVELPMPSLLATPHGATVALTLHASACRNSLLYVAVNDDLGWKLKDTVEEV